MVVWIIGLSGAGKTTLARKVVEIVRSRGGSAVLLDGDEVRELYGDQLGHDDAARRISAHRMCKLCELLDAQGINVVAAFLSKFEESRTWCRRHLSSYYEVYVEAPLETLFDRDSKGLYSRFHKGEITNVAGLDIPFDEPATYDFKIVNDGKKSSLLSHATKIADEICPG